MCIDEKGFIHVDLLQRKMPDVLTVVLSMTHRHVHLNCEVHWLRQIKIKYAVSIEQVLGSVALCC